MGWQRVRGVTAVAGRRRGRRQGGGGGDGRCWPRACGVGVTGKSMLARSFHERPRLWLCTAVEQSAALFNGWRPSTSLAGAMEWMTCACARASGLRNARAWAKRGAARRGAAAGGWPHLRLVQMLRQRELHQDAMHGRVAVELADLADQLILAHFVAVVDAQIADADVRARFPLGLHIRGRVGALADQDHGEAGTQPVGHQPLRGDRALGKDRLRDGLAVDQIGRAARAGASRKEPRAREHRVLGENRSIGETKTSGKT